MMAKYPDDKFEVILRRIQPISPPEWRLKCSDCPGKVYKPGPGETLSNFEVHLKNRSHRQCVDARVDDAAKPQAGLSPPYLQQSNEMALEA
ncbi:hypothetical protein BJ165DRAFT_1476795 [Panaeolus papilionaceus]|nr:hypothetical protein BJ165DRAFT_1476795 [Panaeolus papilionaceus]